MILAHASIKSVDMVNKKIAKQKMCMLIFIKSCLHYCIYPCITGNRSCV